MNDDPLSLWREQELDLPALVAACRSLLEATDVNSGDGRVSAVPDARTIRYYQSTGLVSRPLRYEGRQAIYGFEQLLQAVAVKLLQARGMSLAQVQPVLGTASLEQLEQAVMEALSLRSGARPEPPRLDAPGLAPPGPSPRPLLSAELMAGVQVTIDPALVDDPEALLRTLALALEGGAEDEGARK